MDEKDSSRLRTRLKNCLQTVLDVQTSLKISQIDEFFSNETLLITKFMQKIDTLTLSEDEVDKIEIATTHFMNELKNIIEQGDKSSKQENSRLQ